MKRSPDKVFFGVVLVLSILGVFSVANTSGPLAISVFSDPLFFVKQHLVWLVVGYVALITAYLVPIEKWKPYSPYLFYISVFLLLLVLVPGVGSKLLGARRWIAFGPVSIQPSEVIKLTLAIYFAYLFSVKKPPLKNYVWTLALVVGLIMLQPDLGTTITVVLVGVSQLFVMGIPLMSFAVLALAGTIAGILLILTSDYRRERLMSFFSTHADPTGVSYHVRQILLAIGSGGLLGVGIGQSRQKQLFLPETATDSVFAVIAEELGFVGSTIIIFLLAFFALRAIKIAANADDDFKKTLSIGIATWIGGQVLLNIASMVAIVPLTGIPLPFFSYGGSALVMILSGVGILLQVSAHGKKESNNYSIRRPRHHHRARSS